MLTITIILGNDTTVCTVKTIVSSKGCVKRDNFLALDDVTVMLVHRSKQSVWSINVIAFKLYSQLTTESIKETIPGRLESKMYSLQAGWRFKVFNQRSLRQIY